MGAWGAGLYADDTTCDVRDQYVKALRTGLSDQVACRQVLQAYGLTLHDHQVACLVYFALADTAWRHGRLSDDIRSKALALLEAGGDLAVWARDAPADVAARKRALRTLQARLTSPQPPPKPVQVSAPTARVVRCAAPIGSVFLLDLPSGARAALVLVGYHALEESINPVFSVQRWKGAPGDPPPAEVLGGTVVFATFVEQYAHVAILPGDRQKDVMASLLPTDAVIEGLVHAPNSTIWWSIGRIAKEIDARLGRAPNAEPSGDLPVTR